MWLTCFALNMNVVPLVRAILPMLQNSPPCQPVRPCPHGACACWRCSPPSPPCVAIADHVELHAVGVPLCPHEFPTKRTLLHILPHLEHLVDGAVVHTQQSAHRGAELRVEHCLWSLRALLMGRRNRQEKGGRPRMQNYGRGSASSFGTCTQEVHMTAAKWRITNSSSQRIATSSPLLRMLTSGMTIPGNH